MARATRGRPPIIVIGMHRSGTTLLTRSLEELGLFMGQGTTRNQESPYTNSINEWLFRQASATWERPVGFDSLLAQPDLVALATDYIQGVITGPSCRRFMGLMRWLRHRSLPALAEPWGWKDPRNTYTLPIWKGIFPEARVLHIMRHGVDVAQSLKVRRDRAAASAAARYRNHRGFYVNNPFAPKRSGFAHSPRCASLDEGIVLWSEYTQRAREHVVAAGKHGLEVRYEDLLANPGENVARIAHFCRLPLDERRLRTLTDRFNKTRAFAYESSPDLVEIAKRHAKTLANLGYES